MGQMLRIGHVVVNMDQAVLMEDTSRENPAIMLYVGDRQYRYTWKDERTEYHALKKYMEHCQTLANHNALLVQKDYFDPFLDQMPATLFTVFQSIRGSEDMVLSLLHDGQGGVWAGNEKDQRIDNALVRWHTFDEALEKLQDFAASQKEQVADLP